MENAYKEVRFDKYCKKCRYFDKKETEDPCDECLSEPSNMDSHKPTKWEERKWYHLSSQDA